MSDPIERSRLYRWRAVIDSRTCDYCRQMDGRIFSGLALIRSQVDLLGGCQHDPEGDDRCRCAFEAIDAKLDE